MSILRALERRGLERRGADPRLPWGNSDPPAPSAMGGAVAGTNVTEQTALQVAAVYGSVSVISDSVSSLPVDLMSSPHRRSGTQLKPSQLLTQPYIEISAQDWWVQFVISLALRGNFFGQIVARDSNLYPTQIKPIHPDHASVRRDSSGNPEYRYHGLKIPLDDIFHVRLLSVAESLVGLNPVEYLRNIFGLARAADMYGGAFFANSAYPGGWIKVEEDLDVDEAKAMKQQWLQMQQGIGQAQLPAVLTGGAEFHPITINPEDMQFLQSRQLDASTISGQIFRVPPHMIGIVDRTTSWGCLPGDAQVFTTSGPQAISDVQTGDEVWSIGDDSMQPARVTGWQMTGYKPLLSIQTTARTLRVTSAHHVPIRRYFGTKDGRRFGECGWESLLIDAKDVRPGDYLMVPHGFAPEDGETTAPNGRELTVEAMEFCGLYLGDGSMDKNRVEIAHEREPDHMVHYANSMRSEFAVEPYVDNRGTRTRFSSLPARELLECGFTGTALTKRVPDWVYGLTPGLQLALLRGYLDADGSVQRGRIIFSSAHKLLLEDVRHLCIQLGIPVGRVCLGRLGGRGQIRGREHVSHPKWQLSLSGLPYNARIGSNSPRKASRFADAPHLRRGRYDEDWTGADDNAQGAGTDWPYKDVVLQRVIRVDEGKLRVPVYDIEVAGPAMFVADGVLVGNTGIEQQEMGFVRNTLLGYLSRGERALTAVHPPGQFVKFDQSERLRGDKLQRYTSYNMGRLGGWLSADEIRAEEDMAPIPDGQGTEYLVPINSELLGQAIDTAKKQIAGQLEPSQQSPNDAPSK